MKVHFEFDDGDIADGNGEKKLRELKEVEKLLLEEIKKADRQRLENWLKALPEKPF